MSNQLLEWEATRRAVSEQPESELLIKEVRRRTRRCRLLAAGAVVVLAALGSGIYASSGRSSSPPSTGSSQASGTRTGAVSTGKVTPDQPIALAVSRGGDLYIGDRGRNEILEWMPSGRFRIVAGTGVAGLSGDGGAANRAEVNNPGNLVVASDGTLYFAQVGHTYAPVDLSSGETFKTFSTAIREITLAGTIRTIAGLHPRCSTRSVRSVPAESALFNGASLALSPSGAMSVNANLCVDNAYGSEVGPNYQLLASSGRFIRDTSDPIPAVASIDCGSGVRGPGFHVFACASGGGETAYGHGPELLVVRSDGSSVAYPDNDNQSGDFAVGDREVVATYDGNLVLVTSSRLVPLLTNEELQSALRIQPGAHIGALTVGADGDTSLRSLAQCNVLPARRPFASRDNPLLERLQN